MPTTGDRSDRGDGPDISKDTKIETGKTGKDRKTGKHKINGKTGEKAYGFLRR